MNVSPRTRTTALHQSDTTRPLEGVAPPCARPITFRATARTHRMITSAKKRRPSVTTRTTTTAAPAVTTRATTTSGNHYTCCPDKPRRGRRRLLHDDEQRKARRKAQCRLNQRRYRARQRGIISTLSLETGGLNGYLQDLCDYRDFLTSYLMHERNFVAGFDEERPVLVAKYYLRTFRAGFALHSTESSALQESFVRLVCAPDLIAHGATADGIDALLLQLKRYTSYHGTFDMRPQDVRVLVAPSQATKQSTKHEALWIVQARGRVKLRLSRDTLMLVYPHILQHHDQLAQRVVGQTIEPEFTVTFYFDANAKVTKLDQHIDFAGAFSQLLGVAEDVATLLDGMLISPFSELGLDPQGRTAESALTRGCKQLSLKYILL
ncbi:unnamed protein product [Hyaloperonospora brassicae]|uniref:Uncharacterized protein n=1 Tax=Hyaloperonospora brassicae TaxID=162125 RepID=A0AAV0U639_HYABA|nr:unnamed protein product [Hyaloperonospora brassicae]